MLAPVLPAPVLPAPVLPAPVLPALGLAALVQLQPALVRPSVAVKSMGVEYSVVLKPAGGKIGLSLEDGPQYTLVRRRALGCWLYILNHPRDSYSICPTDYCLCSTNVVVSCVSVMNLHQLRSRSLQVVVNTSGPSARCRPRIHLMDRLVMINDIHIQRFQETVRLKNTLNYLRSKSTLFMACLASIKV